MDIASQALLGGTLRVAAGAIVGYLIYHISMPATASRGAVASGRRFFAWVAGLSCLTFFGKWVFAPNADNFAAWVISLVVWGSVAFFIGLAWGAFHSGRAASAPPVARDSRTEIMNPEARAILEVRLARGEISAAEFKELIGVLGGSTNLLAAGQPPAIKSPVAISVPAAPVKQPRDLPPVQKPPVRPEDFADPKTAEAVRAMLEALKK